MFKQAQLGLWWQLFALKGCVGFRQYSPISASEPDIKEKPSSREFHESQELPCLGLIDYKKKRDNEAEKNTKQIGASRKMSIVSSLS